MNEIAASVQQHLVPGLMGMSITTDAVFLKAMHTEANRQLGRSITTLRYRLYGPDFHDIVQHIQNGKHELVEQMIHDASDSLKNAGADFLVVTANTVSAFAEAMDAAPSLPLLSIAQASLEASRQAKLEKVGILATRSTIRSGMYQRMARNLGIEIVEPNDDIAVSIQEVILRELVHGRFSENGVATVVRAIDWLAAQGAQGVALACTDLTLLTNVLNERCDLPLFDSTTLLAAATARASIRSI